MNYKNLHLIFWFTFFSTFCFGSELVIEVTTDKYPNETSWKVFDTNKNLILGSSRRCLLFLAYL